MICCFQGLHMQTIHKLHMQRNHNPHFSADLLKLRRLITQPSMTPILVAVDDLLIQPPAVHKQIVLMQSMLIIYVCLVNYKP